MHPLGSWRLSSAWRNAHSASSASMRHDTAQSITLREFEDHRQMDEAIEDADGGQIPGPGLVDAAQLPGVSG